MTSEMDGRAAHYCRVWDYLTVDMRDEPKNGRALVTGFVIHAVLDGRSARNVVTQWEIDADSLVEQSLEELRGFQACLPDFLRLQDGMPDKVGEAYAALAEYFVEMADHAAAPGGLREIWQEIIPQLREAVEA
jgi:hypothetical protein